jgi:hypothetical protein
VHVPVAVNVKTVSGPSDVEIGTQLFALAGTGIETKRLVSKDSETIVATLARAALTFMRTTPKITFTSLLE